MDKDVDAALGVVGGEGIIGFGEIHCDASESGVD